MQRPQCFIRSWGGCCGGTRQVGWAQPLVACLLCVQAYPQPSAQASSCQQWLPFWAPSSRKEGSSALTMPLGVMCWLAASQQIPRRALSCHQAGTQSCLTLLDTPPAPPGQWGPPSLPNPTRGSFLPFSWVSRVEQSLQQPKRLRSTCLRLHFQKQKVSTASECASIERFLATFPLA